MLLRLTGDKAYEKQFAADVRDVTPSTQLSDDRRYGPMVYALGQGRAGADADLSNRIRAALLFTADQVGTETASKRALRWGGNWCMPMLVGQQTTPLGLDVAVAYTLVRHDEPAKAKGYLGVLYTTCDYFLGCNSLNMTWVTGLGPRHPNHVFHMDAWYNGKGSSTRASSPTARGARSETWDKGPGTWPGRTRPSIPPSTSGPATNDGSTTAARP